MIIWLTGQPGSGKTTLARALHNRRVVEWVVDGDDLRRLSNPGYDEAGRRRNVDRAQAVASYLNQYGWVAVSLVAPYRDQRDAFAAEYQDVLEVYLHYESDRGKHQFWVPEYEPPLNSLSYDTDTMTVRQIVESLLEFI